LLLLNLKTTVTLRTPCPKEMVTTMMDTACGWSFLEVGVVEVVGIAAVGVAVIADEGVEIVGGVPQHEDHSIAWLFLDSHQVEAGKI